MKKSVSARKKGVTLVEVCITIAIFMILMSEALVFSAMVRTQLIKNDAITKSMREAVMISELIRDDFYEDDDPSKKITMGKGEGASDDITRWEAIWLRRAKDVFHSENITDINGIKFEVRRYDENGIIIPQEDITDYNNAGDVVVCTIEYILPSQTATGTYKFVLIRHTVYTE